ncbi:hypothetical protein GCM10017710_26350 [Arthrobacter ramosus]
MVADGVAALEGHSDDPGVPLGVLGFQNQGVPAPGSDLDPADRGREFVPRRSLGEYIPFGERRGISLTVRAEDALWGRAVSPELCPFHVDATEPWAGVVAWVKQGMAALGRHPP